MAALNMYVYEYTQTNAQVQILDQLEALNISEATLHILFHNNISSALIQAENAVESFCILYSYIDTSVGKEKMA